MGKTMKVRESYFENNLQGITSNGSIYDSISNNIFYIELIPSSFVEDRPDEDTPSLLYDTWGIYMFGSYYYTIENNLFDVVGLIPSDDSYSRAYGVIANHAYKSSGLIKNNIFTDLSSTYSGSISLYTTLYGTQTEEDNSFLTMTCNEYIDFDREDKEWLICPTTGNPDFDNKLQDQGTGCGEFSAANLFTNQCGNPTQNIKVGVLEEQDSNGDLIPLFPFLYYPNDASGNAGYPDCHDDMEQVNVQDCDNDLVSQSQVCPNETAGTGKPYILIDTYSPVGIASELNNGNYSLKEQVELTGGVASVYKDQERAGDAISFLEAMNSDQSEILLFHLYLQQNLFSEAQTSLTELTVRNVYDTNWNAFYQLLLNVKISARNYGSLTTTELQEIENIANSNSHAFIAAQSLLGMLQQTTYNRVPQKFDVSSNKKQTVLENMEILVYPNPTKNTLTIQLPFEKAEALIYDLRGKLVQQYFVEEGENKIELNLQTGSYIVQFRFDNKLITQKIIVLP